MKYLILVFLLVSSLSFGHDRPKYKPSYGTIFNIHSEYGSFGYSSQYYDPNYTYIRVPRYKVYKKPRYRVKYRPFDYHRYDNHKHHKHKKHKGHR